MISSAWRKPFAAVAVVSTILALTLTESRKAGDSNVIPDHVCLPEISEEDSAWLQLEVDRLNAKEEFDVTDLPATDNFEIEEKAIVAELLKNKTGLASRYKTAYALTHQIFPVEYPCSKPEAHSNELASACNDLAIIAAAERVANNGGCKKDYGRTHVAVVDEQGPCAEAAKRYWAVTDSARLKFNAKSAAAESAYMRRMMPACSVLQRITFNEIDRPALRARQECVARLFRPSDVTKCTSRIVAGH